MHIIFNYGHGVTTFPKQAIQKILDSSANITETRVLFAVFENPPTLEMNEKNYYFFISRSLNIPQTKVENAIGFWRGVGIFTLHDDADETEKPEDFSSTEKQDETNNARTPNETDDDTDTKRKILQKGEVPKYTAEDITALLQKDGEKLKIMIDECQQIMGWVFNSTEINVFLSMCDYIGLEPDYIVTAVAYFNRKRPGCKIRYIEKAVLNLVNQDINTLSDLDLYVKDMEVYDGIANRIRSLAGIGGRAFSKKENEFIHQWTRGYKYNEDIIELVYEITVNNTGEFSFNYANTILESWFKSGVKTLDDANAANEKFRAENTHKKEKTAKKSENSSFALDDFFAAALEKSRLKMAERNAEINKKETEGG